MPDRIRLFTLGQCAIEVGDKTLTPATRRLFALAVVLTSSKAAAFTREELARILWDPEPGADTQHMLRQLLYRLRLIGFPVKEDRSRRLRVDHSLWLPTASSDFSIDRFWEEFSASAGSGFSWLPGFVPLSAAMSEWMEGVRTRLTATISRELHSALQSARLSSDWTRAEHIAVHLRSIDPCNEDAVEALAFSLALHGAPNRATEVLRQYHLEVGPADGWITQRTRALAASLERNEGRWWHSTEPVIGRSDEVRSLDAFLTSTKRLGMPMIVQLTGLRGVGKTRLARDFALRASLGGCTVVYPASTADAQIASQIHTLLESPGALGAAPESLYALRTFCRGESPNGSLPSRALSDLLASLAEESPLVLVSDCSGIASANSAAHLAAAMAVASGPILLLVVGTPSVVSSLDLPANLAIGKLTVPLLSWGDSLEVAKHFLERLSVTASTETIEACAMVGAGLPQLVKEAAIQVSSSPNSPLSLSWEHPIISANWSEVSPTTRRGILASVRGKDLPLTSAFVLNALTEEARDELCSLGWQGSQPDLPGPLFPLPTSIRSNVERASYGLPVRRSRADYTNGAPFGSARHTAREALENHRYEAALGMALGGLDGRLGLLERLDLLAIGASAAFQLNESTSAAALVAEFLDIAPDVGSAPRRLASAWTRLLSDRSAIGNVPKLAAHLHSLGQRLDLPRGLRARAVVAHSKIAEFGRASAPHRECIDFVGRLNVETGERSVLLTEGLLCHSAYFLSREETTRLAATLRSLAVGLKPGRRAVALTNSANALSLAGDTAAAKTLYDEALQLSRTGGSPYVVTSTAHKVARFLLEHDSLESAIDIAGPTLSHSTMTSKKGGDFLIRCFNSLLFLLADQPLYAERLVASRKATVESSPLNDMCALMVDAMAIEVSRTYGGSVDLPGAAALCARVAEFARYRPMDLTAAVLLRSLRRANQADVAERFIKQYLSSRTTQRGPIAAPLSSSFRPN